MDDMYKSIKAFLYDRTSSPLFGAFLTSWLLVNFKIVLTIFSGEDLVTKFQIIENLFSITAFEQQHYWLGFLVHSLLLPAVLTISYIYLYPLLAKPVYEHSLRKQRELREVRQTAENESLLSVEESHKIRVELASLKDKRRTEIESYTNENSSLLKERSNLLKRIQDLERSGGRASPYDKAGLDKYEMQSKIDQLPSGNFSLEQLMGENDWAELDDGEKRELGKKFNEYVKAGGYLGISYEGRDASNHALYKKASARINKSNETQKLSMLKDKILQVFVKSNASSLDRIDLERMRVHPIELDLALDELLQDGYLNVDFNGSYFLKTKGKKYLSDNNMLE